MVTKPTINLNGTSAKELLDQRIAAINALRYAISTLTDDMFARIPVLLIEGTTKAEIAVTYGVTVGTLAVLCCRRGISLRKGGSRPKRTNLTLPDEPLPLSDGVFA